jgi:hypothetical protein
MGGYSSFGALGMPQQGPIWYSWEGMHGLVQMHVGRPWHGFRGFDLSLNNVYKVVTWYSIIICPLLVGLVHGNAPWVR